MCYRMRRLAKNWQTRAYWSEFWRPELSPVGLNPVGVESCQWWIVFNWRQKMRNNIAAIIPWCAVFSSKTSHSLLVSSCPSWWHHFSVLSSPTRFFTNKKPEENCPSFIHFVSQHWGSRGIANRSLESRDQAQRKKMLLFCNTYFS